MVTRRRVRHAQLWKAVTAWTAEMCHCWEFRELSLLGVVRCVTAGSAESCHSSECRELSLLEVQRIVTARSVESCHCWEFRELQYKAAAQFVARLVCVVVVGSAPNAYFYK